MNVVFRRTTLEQLIQRCQSVSTQFTTKDVQRYSQKFVVTLQRNIEKDFEYIWIRIISWNDKMGTECKTRELLCMLKNNI